MATNKENLKKLGEQLKRAAELKAQKQTTTTVSSQALPIKEEKPQNPYFKARIKVLMGYPEWRRNEIATLEKNGDINNRHYLSFVKDVAEQGDKYSS